MVTEDDTPESYDIQFSEPAEAELEMEYLRLASIRFELAERWNEGILTACQSLSQLPKRYPLVPDKVKGGYQTRRMPFRIGQMGYSILYAVLEVAEDVPAFVRILHIRRSL